MTGAIFWAQCRWIFSLLGERMLMLLIKEIQDEYEIANES